MIDHNRTNAPRPKAPSSIDRHIGERIRLRRQECDIAQGALAERLGISFQQIQKYENGKNRIGAGRLQQVADCLDVSISYFFEDLPQVGKKAQALEGQRVASLLRIEGSVRLLRAFAGIQEPKVRRKLVDLAEALAVPEDPL